LLLKNNLYTEGKYLANNPTWHEEDSEWKAKQILLMIQKNNLYPKTVCEIGCGAGKILQELQENMDENVSLIGYEISPQAYKLCENKKRYKLDYKIKDILLEENISFDVILLIDLIEHLEDYFQFLRKIKDKSKYKILHIPLDLSIIALLRKSPLSNSRKKAGHLHFFTKEIAIQILKDIGYEVLDSFYTAGSIELPSKSLITKISKLPRKLAFFINKDLAVRIFGGYSLMVLVK